ncbi:MAG: extracellular solute-binding protein [Rhodospirillaceae bacterium]|jgi:spermidine/putrescine transport system substrate-binding protein|nr:extracellular solute-binding protein [Rhodospirillaceae bacterium]MBT3558614.1 extracellular solute-binding protein [Rhodospirillales bacterium]MBT4038890.1 extracellular solute-binding protein [Rhodospirillales bacterium]MBT4625883.1 extracellular solute-binding protein [Rhodospirillales bacterium]MBT5350551.1 extracellular solute-binding protein [Rhodospirillales bacterium]
MKRHVSHVTRDPLDMLLSDRMDRREFHKILGALGLGFAATTLGSSKAHAEEDANFFSWSGYELPEFHQGYIDKYGTGPKFSAFGGITEAMNKIRAGFKTDVAHPCAGEVTAWNAAGIIAPFDTSALKHWPDYFETLRTIDHTLSPSGENLFVPWDWGNSSILYRTDIVDLEGEEESWGILFDERYKGKLATYNSPQAGVQTCAQVLGYTNLDRLTDAQLAEVRKLLVKQRGLLRFYWDSQTEAGQAMVAGELVATYAWNDLYKTVSDEGLAVKFAVPKEGARNWVCGLVLTAPESRVASDERVYDFLDAMMSPEAGAYLIDAYSYGSSNSKAFDLVAPERVAEVGLSDPEAFLAKGLLKPIPAEFDQKYVELWEEVRLGM